jgi:transposase
MTKLFAALPEQRDVASVAGGAARLRRAERGQMELRAASLDELLSADHPARLVWSAVERMDLSTVLERVVAREGVGGHPATDPAILVALWLYATIDGVGSARELARLCESDAPYRWLCGGVSMNHHTLSDFRVGQGEWLDRHLTTSIAALLAGGLIGLDQVAQDGLRIRASAGSGSFRRRPSLHKARELAAAQIDRLRSELAADPAAGRGRRQAAQQRAAADKLARLDAALAALGEAMSRKKRNKGKPEDARVSTTDSQARVMRMPDGGFRPAYNLQLAAETTHGFVVGVAASCSGADQDNLTPMVEQVWDRHGVRPARWLADGGFVSKPAIDQLAEQGVALYAPATGVAVPARGESSAVQAWRERMASTAGQALYRRRAAVIEWVNAGCRNRGLYAVNIRGAAKLRAVGLWHAMAHNMQCLWRVQVAAA